MDRVPVETWMHIFAFACLDDGTTGRSLSLVSKYFRDASRSVKYQSLALQGPHQILAFADLLQSSPECRRVRHLYVSGCAQQSQNNRSSVQRWLDFIKSTVTAQPVADMENVTFADLKEQSQKRRDVLQNTVNNILSTLSSTLRTLSLCFSSEGGSFPINTRFPHLTDLALCGAYISASDATLASAVGAPPSLPSIQRVDFDNCNDLNHRCYSLILQNAPCIRDVHISRLASWSDTLAHALGPRIQGRQRTEAEGHTATNALETICLQPGPAPNPGSRCGSLPSQHSDLCRQLKLLVHGKNAAAVRILDVPVNWIKPCQEMKREWVERVDMYSLC